MSYMWLWKAFIATCEAIAIGYIISRAKKSKNSYVRAQLLLVPFLVNSMVIQVVESLIWLDEDNMVDIKSSLIERKNKVDHPEFEEGWNFPQECTNWNRNLTVVLWLICIPIQPLLVTYALRRMGDKMNKERLMTAEILAFGILVIHWIRYVDQQYIEGKYADNPLFSEAPRWYIHKFMYRTYDDRSTCSYKGYFGNLFHTLNTSHDWFTPNGVTFAICFFPAVFAKPYKFFSIFLLITGIYMIQLKRSFYLMCEVISVYNCRMGVLSCLYVLIQPIVFPCSPTEFNYEYDDTTTIVDYILSDIGIMTNLDKTIPMFSEQKSKKRNIYNGLGKYN